MILGAYALYYTLTTVQANKQRENYDKLCAFMTDELNNNINENTTCTEYYCYYKPYAPPEGYETTQTLCACDCKLENGEIVSIQVLTPK